MKMIYGAKELARSILEVDKEDVPEEFKKLKTLTSIAGIYRDLLKYNYKVLEVKALPNGAYEIHIGQYLHSQSFSTIHTLYPEE